MFKEYAVDSLQYWRDSWSGRSWDSVNTTANWTQLSLFVPLTFEKIYILGYGHKNQQ